MLKRSRSFSTQHAPFEFKDSDQTYKGIDVEVLDKVAEINSWDFRQILPGFDAAVTQFRSWSSGCHHGRNVKRQNVKSRHVDTYYDTKVVIATTKADKITSTAN